jgi:hypothetical protein
MVAASDETRCSLSAGLDHPDNLFYLYSPHFLRWMSVGLPRLDAQALVFFRSGGL